MLFAITTHFQHDLHNSKRTLNYFIYPTEKIISSFIFMLKKSINFKQVTFPFPVLPVITETSQYNHFILIYHNLKLCSLMKMAA